MIFSFPTDNILEWGSGNRGPEMTIIRNVITVASLAASIAWVGATPAAATSLIDVQFAGRFSFFCANGTNSCPNAQQTGAAYVGAVGDRWNYFVSASGSGALVNTAGAASGVSINFSSDGFYSSYSDGYKINNFYGTPYQNLMGGYLATNNQNGIVITLGGLAAHQAFDLYTYSEEDIRNASGRAMDVSVNGTTKRDTQSGAGTFIAGDTFLHFAGTADARGFVNISVSTVNGESDLNGLQLSVASVPEPAMWAMMLVGFGSLGAALRAKRRATGVLA